MKKLGKKIKTTKESLQAFKYCMCTGCGCIGTSQKYSNEVADYRASIN